MSRLANTAICLILLIMSVGCEDKKEETAAKLPEVTVTLNTVPTGATVIIDGKRLEPKTPFEKVFHDNYEHMIEIQAKGYETKWIRIPPSKPGSDENYDPGEIKLQPVRVPVILRSEPTGANVTMDGDDLGTTPVYLKGVSPGNHEAVFSLAGHKRMQKTVKVQAGEMKNMLVKLPSNTGTITILTNPVGADIFVQGDPKGTSDVDGRLVVENIPAGVITIEVRKDGFESRKMTIDLKPSEKKVASVPELTPKPGQLKVTSTPEGASVYRDDGFAGTTPLVIKDLPPGQYKIKVSKKNYESKTKLVTVFSNITKAASFELESKFGSITVVSQPSECTIIVDGVSKGKTEPGDAPGTSKPLEISMLTPKVHHLVFEKAGYAPVKKRILVERGKNIRIPAVKLKELWLPTHILRTKGQLKGEPVKLISDNGDTIDVEYKKGNVKMRVMRANIEDFTPIK